MRLFIWVFLMVLTAKTVNATEEPAYQVIIQDDAFEIRQYAPMILAEVGILGDMGPAGSAGFNLLADYIFGNNRVPEDMPAATITESKSQKIAMTAPVNRVEAAEDQWIVSFVMPSEWTMETLPLPNKSEVVLREQPEQLMAAIRFSGFGRESSFRNKQQDLQGWLNAQGYVAIGDAGFAGYNPPWTPPMLRRNEVLIPVEKLLKASTSNNTL